MISCVEAKRRSATLQSQRRRSAAEAGTWRFHPPEVSLLKAWAPALRPGASWCALVWSKERPSKAADLWAAGLCLHSFLAGRLPQHVPQMDLENALEHKCGAEDCNKYGFIGMAQNCPWLSGSVTKFSSRCELAQGSCGMD